MQKNCYTETIKTGTDRYGYTPMMVSRAGVQKRWITVIMPCTCFESRYQRIPCMQRWSSVIIQSTIKANFFAERKGKSRKLGVKAYRLSFNTETLQE